MWTHCHESFVTSSIETDYVPLGALAASEGASEYHKSLLILPAHGNMTKVKCLTDLTEP